MDTVSAVHTHNLSLYETDYLQWLERTVEQLQAQSYAQVDWQNLIEEIAGMGRSERRRLESIFVECYTGAIKQAIAETSLSEASFPVSCPYTIAEILDDGFLPGESIEPT